MIKNEKIILINCDQLISDILKDNLANTYEIFYFLSNDIIIRNVTDINPDLILFNIEQPNNLDFELITDIHADHSLCEIPLICLINSDDDTSEEICFACGARDVITKPLKNKIFLTKIIKYISTYVESVNITLKEESLKSLFKQTNKVIFEYDLLSEKIRVLFNFESIFGRNPVTKSSEKDAMNANVIHPEDMTTFKNIFVQARKGESIPQVCIRIKTSINEYKWVLISTAVIKDKYGCVYKAIATLEDINERTLITCLNDERLGNVIANSKLCMFDFYIKDQRMICSPVTMETFGSQSVIEDAVETVIESGSIHPNYIDRFREIYRKISEGSPLERLEYIQFRRDGYEMFVEITLTTIFDDSGIPIVAIGIMKDLTDRLLLMKQAYYDDLTGARNLIKFKLDATEIMKENTELRYMVIKLDIDNFKLLNEVYGYELCDKILIEFSSAVEISLDDKCDIHARINADEFILLIGFENEEMLSKKIQNKDQIVSEYLRHLIPDKIEVRKGRYRIEVGETDFNAIFEKVNFAHRYAKRNNQLVCNYDSDMKKLALKHKDIESRMEDALTNDEFVVFLQPKYQLSDETIAGAEALVRWKTAGKDIQYPKDFIPVFEQNGFITRLDMYMFEQVCKVIRDWIDREIKPVAISVNFSRLHLNDEYFVSKLSELSDKYSIPHNLLEVEITETAIFDNIEILGDVLEDLHASGFTLSMDDFGTGYSSLGLLKSIPVDVIKLDKSFFDDSRDNERARLVIGSVMDMAKKLNAHTVAEGVETKENVDMLKVLGCDTVQGYYYAKPMPVDEFTSKINVNKS